MSVQRAAAATDRDLTAHELLDLFPVLRRRLEGAIPRELRDEIASVTIHQLEALHQLVETRGLTMAQLAERQSIGLSSATALADRLLRQGLAVRTSDPSDRRIVRLVPTEAASELVQRFVETKRRIALRALSVLDDDELVDLHRLVTKIATARPNAEENRGG